MRKMDEYIRKSLEAEVAKLATFLQDDHDWSPRERIRMQKAYEQLTETNEMLEKFRDGFRRANGVRVRGSTERFATS
jgi:lipopolysaccharide biosynthesis regulator YciM